MSEDCPHCVFEKTEANCRGCFEGSHYKPKPITNADRIRAMTDEDLAMLLQPGCPDRVCRDSPPHDCYNCWLDWLKQEVKNG